jgi:acetoin utilization deacetylase AcuC-like enzyme
MADFDELLLAHSQNYIDMLRGKLSNCDTVTSLDSDTYVSPDSLQSVLAGAGTVLQGMFIDCCMLPYYFSAIDVVMDETSSIRNAFCIVRPPGHHAGRDGLVHDSASQGFCLVNNIAVGAFYALKKFPETIRRVAIVDIDVHHGDGTQQIVAGHDNILFISLHAFDGDFYPRTGNWEEGVEVDNVFNIPLELDFGSEVFFRAFMSIGYPAICQFAPDLIMVSAGFDARKGDTLTPHRNHKGLMEEDYYKIAETLGRLAFEVCDGRLVSALEGGYGTEYLAQCTVAHTCGLMDSTLINWFQSTHWKSDDAEAQEERES